MKIAGTLTIHTETTADAEAYVATLTEDLAKGGHDISSVSINIESAEDYAEGAGKEPHDADPRWDTVDG